MKAFLKNVKIRTKLFVAYFISMSLTIAIIYTVSAAKINQTFLSEASGGLRSSTLQIKENIINFLLSHEMATDNIVYNRTFITNISSRSGTRIVKYDRTKEAKAVLSLLQSVYPSISDVRVYMFRDSVLFDGKTFIKYTDNIRGAPEDMDSWIAWTGRRVNAKGENVINLNRTILDYPLFTTRIGVLSIEIPEDEFFRFIEEESLNKSIAIVNEKGEIITASDYHLSGYVLDRLESLKSEETEGQVEFLVEGTKYMMFYTTADNGWVVASYTPITSLLSVITDINRYVVAVIILSITVFMAIAAILLDLLTKRLMQFASAANRVGDGQYDFILDISGGDEIGQLADSFNKMTKKLDVLFNDVYVAQIKQKEAELLALQAQINPHFLYNVLSSLGFAALKKDAPEIRDTLNSLADFYRFSLSKSSSLVTLEEEISQIKTYMAIQGMRFGDMITISYNIAPELLKAKIQKLTIQPFVENAIHHGLRDSETRLTIKITALTEGNCMNIKIADNGVGIPQEMLADIQEKICSDTQEDHYGIQNVHNRIRLYFGDRYGISLHSSFGAGTTAVICLPTDIQN